MKKAIFITLTCVVALSTVRGQDMWGIANSNYAGNFAIDINPSSMAVSPIKYELNILSGNMTFYNNYLYLPKGKMSVGKFFKADYLKMHSYPCLYIDLANRSFWITYRIKGNGKCKEC